MAYDKAGYAVSDPTSFKTLLANSDDVTTRKVTIVTGEVRKAGAVLGKITASSKYKLSASAAGDGSQTPDFVLSHDVDATAGDVEAIVYETATVCKDALILGAGHTVDSIREGLRVKGIKIDD